MEMLVLGARVLTVGRPAWVKTFVDPFLVVVVTSVRFGLVLSPENDINHGCLDKIPLNIKHFRRHRSQIRLVSKQSQLCTTITYKL